MRNTIARLYARTDASLAAFRFSGPQAVATSRRVTQRGEFSLVETARDTWSRTEDGWKLTDHVPLASRYEGPAADPEVTQAVTADVKRFAKPLGGLHPLRAAAACVAVHRDDLPEGSGETVLAAAEIPAFVLSLARVRRRRRRWAAGWRSTCSTGSRQLAKTDAVIFLEVNHASKN